MNTAETMSGAEVKKFLFDNDFTNLESAAPVPESKEGAKEAAEEDALAKEIETAPEEEIIEEVIIPTFSEEEVNKAREEGVARGRDEALKDLEGSLQKKLAETMQELEQKLGTIEDEQAAQKEERSRSAASIAAVIVRKLFPSLNMEKAMDEISHMIEQSLEKTSGETKMVFSVASEIKDEVERKVAEMVTLSGREVEFKVVGNTDIQLGDCTIEWSGGGLVRDQDQMWREIDEIVERNLGTAPAAEVSEKTANEKNDETSDETDETNDGNPL